MSWVGEEGTDREAQASFNEWTRSYTARDSFCSSSSGHTRMWDILGPSTRQSWERKGWLTQGSTNTGRRGWKRLRRFDHLLELNRGAAGVEDSKWHKHPLSGVQQEKGTGGKSFLLI